MENADREALFGESSSRRSASPPDTAGASASSGAGSNQASSHRHGGAMGGRIQHYSDGSPDVRGNLEQQQQQPPPSGPLLWAQVRDSIDVTERRRGLRSAHESVEVGREALERLDDQKERLERSEMVLDSTRYAIERSARVLRGMTFWGKIRNAFSNDPEVPQQPAGNTRAGTATGNGGNGNYDPDVPAEGFICPDCRGLFPTSDALVAHHGLAHTIASADDDEDARGWGAGGGATQYGTGGGAGDVSGGSHGGPIPEPGSSTSLKDQLFGGREGWSGQRAGGAERKGGGGGVIAEQKAVMASQDAYLDSVGQAVKELGLLGRNIGESLDGQGATLDRVAEKSSEANDRTAFVTRKAARQAQSSKPNNPTFVMSLALQEVTTGLYLAVTGEEVVLQGRELRNVCRFEAWERQHGIMGLKSSVTRKWLGQTFLGYLRVSGSSFGKNHEWQADLRGKETTMVCCSANWGAGGYLSSRPNGTSIRMGDTTLEGSTAASGGSKTNNGRDSAAEMAELSLVDATLANRPRAAVFRLVNCDGYTPQPFVGGKLMRNPEPPVGRGSGAGGQLPPRPSSGGGRGEGGEGGW
ncbi:unnamed protein product [Ectocarpus sp. CCAP 1310/34]|nr:unnamed protein product [Ectocarpus sp. CCAP 1310/34]